MIRITFFQAESGTWFVHYNGEDFAMSCQGDAERMCKALTDLHEECSAQRASNEIRGEKIKNALGALGA